MMKNHYTKSKGVMLVCIALLLSTFNLHAQVPSDLMENCNQWKITYPDGEEDKTLCGEANNEYFYVDNSENAIVFFAPIRSNNGSTPNSDYIRSELREREPDGSVDIYWTTEGSHMIYVKQAITHLPINKSHLVATQIHGNKSDGIDDAMVMRLENSHLFLSFNGGDLRSDLTIKTDYTLGDVHEVIFLVVDGLHYCYYSEDGNLLNAYNNGNASSYLVKDGGNDYVMDLNYDQSYFKVGNYTQSNADQEGSDTDDPDNYGEVYVYDFFVRHGTDPGEVIDVTGVNLSPSSASLALGATQQLAASVSPSNATDQGVSYSSNNTSVATVSSSGMVTAVSEGTATITVTSNDGGFTDTSSITVFPPPSGSNLALNKSVTGTGTPDGSNVESNLVDDDPDSRWAVSGFPQSATVDLGAVFSIEATELVCYNDRAYQYIIEASTNGSSYSTVVDRSGNTTPGTNSSPITDTFSAVDARYVRITVSGAANYTGSWVSLEELRVFGEEGSSSVPVTGVSVTPGSVSLVAGSTQQLSVSVSPSNATDQGTSWSSNNTSVATVSSSGLVTAVSQGTAIITATSDDGGHTDSSNITVTSPSSGSNLALSGTTAQSSTGYGGVASRAIDGNTAGNWSSGTITHTNAEAYPWWEVDLGSAHSIGDIVIYNRTDGCCIQRLTNFTVSVLTSSRSEVFSQTFTSYPNPSVTLNAGDVSGQIIRVQLEETNMALSLAEVEVYAGAGSGTLSNLALGKSVSVTDEQTENPGSNLVDDDPDSRWSASGFPQSATIDLGASYSISGTEVICFSDRAYQYTIEASTNGSSYSTIVNRSNNSTPGTNSSPITDAFTAVNARYVRITVSGADSYSGSWVSLEEVRVFGNGSGARTVSNEANSGLVASATVYPVPMNDVLTIDFGGSTQFVGVDLVDMSGRLYLTEHDVTSGKMSLNVSDLPKGVYILRLYQADSSTQVIKVTK